jgi:hypothetical protein
MEVDFIDGHIKKNQEKMAQIELTIKIINDLICKHCVHRFETDYIDITPERSQRITYCIICEYTKND